MSKQNAKIIISWPAYIY